jgi:beta-glucanase (GH16 family)
MPTIVQLIARRIMTMPAQNIRQHVPAMKHGNVARRLIATAAAAALAGTGIVAANPADAAVPAPTGWTQVFGDDFEGNSLNAGNWQVTEGTSYPGGPAGFGTGEVEVSSRNNVSVANGTMSITAQGAGLGPWTAARVETNRTDFMPPAGGKVRFEASLRLPAAANGQSNGYWPAFWILGATYRGNWWNWPTIGEFDIMENVSGLNRTWQTQHCGWLDPATGPNVCNEKDGIGNGGMVNGQVNSCTPSCTTSFHTYTLDWSRADNSATWYIDGRQVHRTQRGVNVPADAWDLATARGFYVILNIAMGGEMPVNNGVPINGSTGGGGHFDADYVAVYNGPGNAPAPVPPGTTTQPPVTQPPVTQPPGTQPPATQPPATQPPSGATTWAAYTTYTIGQIVTYNGVSYSCRLTHTAYPGWEPPNVLALWLPI